MLDERPELGEQRQLPHAGTTTVAPLTVPVGVIVTCSSHPPARTAEASAPMTVIVRSDP